MLAQFRAWAVQNLPVLTFLGFYFLTVVLGNVLYTTSWAVRFLEEYNIPSRFLDFPETFTVGFWLLLFLPFLVTPCIASITRRVAAKRILGCLSYFHEATFSQFTLIATILTVCIIYDIAKYGVFDLFLDSDSFLSAVQSRFVILDKLGFFNLIVLQGLLPYLAFYACIQAIRRREYRWCIAAVVLVIFVATLSIIINMKWPVLLFFIGIMLCIFSYTRTRPYTKTVVGSVLLLVTYFGISALIMHPDIQIEPRDKSAEVIEQGYDKKFISTQVPLSGLGQVAINMLFFPINRMAAGYPYYYHIFTTQGPVCGGILEQAKRSPPCRPSTYIYSTIFGQDGFQGRGTTPAGVHISGYAMGGWALALLALGLASIILGLLSALPVESNATVSAFFISGALAGYHFSQIPGEGVIFYPHGLLWVLLLAGFMAIIGRLKIRLH